ncbi:hypothetical protein D9M70_635380 [compost metagenome]
MTEQQSRLVPPLSNVPASPIFDPATTIIRMHVLLVVCGLGGRTSVYRLMKEDPSFPKPVKLSNSESRGAPIGWVLGEVQEWVRQRIALREQERADDTLARTFERGQRADA